MARESAVINPSLTRHPDTLPTQTQASLLSLTKVKGQITVTRPMMLCCAYNYTITVMHVQGTERSHTHCIITKY